MSITSYSWNSSCWLEKLVCLLKFFIITLLAGAGEEEKGEVTGCLWEEEAAQQTKGKSWEDCRWEAWFPTWSAYSG